MECRAARVVGLLRFDVGRSNHLGPFLGLVTDEPPKFGRRAWNHFAAQIGGPRLNPGIGDKLNRRSMRPTWHMRHAEVF